MSPVVLVPQQQRGPVGAVRNASARVMTARLLAGMAAALLTQSPAFHAETRLVVLHADRTEQPTCGLTARGFFNRALRPPSWSSLIRVSMSPRAQYTCS